MSEKVLIKFYLENGNNLETTAAYIDLTKMRFDRPQLIGTFPNQTLINMPKVAFINVKPINNANSKALTFRGGKK